MGAIEIRFRATEEEAAKLDQRAQRYGFATRIAYIRDRLGLGPPRAQGAPEGNRRNPYGRRGAPK